MFQEAWPPVFARQQRQPQAGLAAENMYIVHWASVAAVAHSQAVENTPKSFVWSAPSHELLACESWKSSQTGGDGGSGLLYCAAAGKTRKRRHAVFISLKAAVGNLSSCADTPPRSSLSGDTDLGGDSQARRNICD